MSDGSSFGAIGPVKPDALRSRCGSNPDARCTSDCARSRVIVSINVSKHQRDQTQRAMDAGKPASVLGHVAQLPVQAFDRMGDVDPPPVGEAHRERPTRMPRGNVFFGVAMVVTLGRGDRPYPHTQNLHTQNLLPSLYPHPPYLWRLSLPDLSPPLVCSPSSLVTHNELFRRARQLFSAHPSSTDDAERETLNLELRSEASSRNPAHSERIRVDPLTDCFCPPISPRT